LEGLDRSESAVLAREKVERALTLRPDYGDAYIVKGAINYYLEWKVKEAEENYYKGWKLSEYGRTPISHCFCPIVEFEIDKRNPEKALEILNNIEKYDPYYPYREDQLFFILQAQGDLQGMLEILQHPTQENAIPYYLYSFGQYENLIKNLESHENREWIRAYWPMLVISYMKTGNTAKGDALLQNMIERSNTERHISFLVAKVYAAIGDRMNAIQWLKRAYKEGDYWLYRISTEPDMAFLLSEPEVKEIVDGIWVH